MVRTPSFILDIHDRTDQEFVACGSSKPSASCATIVCWAGRARKRPRNDTKQEAEPRSPPAVHDDQSSDAQKREEGSLITTDGIFITELHPGRGLFRT